jgi:hypothetical protein
MSRWRAITSRRTVCVLTLLVASACGARTDLFDGSRASAGGGTGALDGGKDTDNPQSGGTAGEDAQVDHPEWECTPGDRMECGCSNGELSATVCSHLGVWSPCLCRPPFCDGESVALSPGGSEGNLIDCFPFACYDAPPPPTDPASCFHNCSDPAECAPEASCDVATAQCVPNQG